MKIALIIGLIGMVFIVIAQVNKSNILPAQSQRDITNTPTDTRPIISEKATNDEKKPDIPRRVMIPTISVDTLIEPVGVDSEGRMDVPKEADNTSWFKPGFKPGVSGSAVLAGHYDREDGSPAVFWEVSKLKIGDEIIVEDESNQQFIFNVTVIKEYPYDDFPIKEVFGESETPRLNLITCRGEWNENTRNYSHRTVVFSELVE